MKTEQKILYVQLLGGFQVTWGGEPLNLPISSATKTMQFFQIIVLSGRKGITRELLVKYLSEGQELSDPANSLRVTNYRLRRILADSGLPNCNYIQIVKGSYCWNYEIPLETDVGEFENLIKEVDLAEDIDEKDELRKKACRLYKGDLLPLLGAEDWVMTEGTYYKNAYIKILKDVLESLKYKGAYEEMFELSSQAARIFPYEEWQLSQIESLMAMGEYDKALSIYNDTSRLYMNDLGVSPSKQMVELYHAMTGRLRGSSESLENIRIQIQEQSVNTGAFYCNLLSFVDICRILNRISERNDKSMSLMLCTFRQTGGDIRKGQRIIGMQMPVLKNIIQKVLRKGDFFTKYSPCQFLIFLTGIVEDNCPIVSERIQKAFMETNPSDKLSLHFSMTSVNEIERKWTDSSELEE